MSTAHRVQPAVKPVHSPIGNGVRVGQVALTAVLVLCAVIALSTAFVDDPFPPEAVVLIATFGALAAVLGIAAVWGGVRSRIVQISVWALPMFFVAHVAALGTWVPDAILAVVTAVAAALLIGAGRRTDRERMDEP